MLVTHLSTHLKMHSYTHTQVLVTHLSTHLKMHSYSHTGASDVFEYSHQDAQLLTHRC